MKRKNRILGSRFRRNYDEIFMDEGRAKITSNIVYGGRSMAREIAIGVQDFGKLRETHVFILIKQNVLGNGGILGMRLP